MVSPEDESMTLCCWVVHRPHKTQDVVIEGYVWTLQSHKPVARLKRFDFEEKPQLAKLHKSEDLQLGNTVIFSSASVKGLKNPPPLTCTASLCR